MQSMEKDVAIVGALCSTSTSAIGDYLDLALDFRRYVTHLDPASFVFIMRAPD
jgi:hypothetical protein